MKLDDFAGPGRLAALFLAFASAMPAAGAPAVELTDPDRPVSLAVVWRIQPGDDLRWADPDVDDGGWRRVLIRPVSAVSTPRRSSPGTSATTRARRCAAATRCSP